MPIFFCSVVEGRSRDSESHVAEPLWISPLVASVADRIHRVIASKRFGGCVIPIRYNFRSLLERRTTSIMTVLGLGMVAMIFVILFGFIGGLKGTMLNAAVERNWVLLSRGAPDETASFIPHALIDIVR